MLERVLRFSVGNPWLVVLATIAVAVAGAFALQRLPIDAVPDITNNQVQINTLYPALSPVEVEKQITFPIETALAGIAGLESTRSLSRNGFSQVTAIFTDDTDIYFARNQVNERLIAARGGLPDGAEPAMGPISTGLGEVYMWTVEYAHPHGKGATIEGGKPGWQGDGAYLTPEGQRLSSDVELAAYLRTIQDWVIRPQLKGVAGVAGVDAIGGYVKQYHVQPDPMKLFSYGLSFSDVIQALDRNNVSIGAGYVEHKGEAYVVRAAGRIQTIDEIEEIVIGSRLGTPIYVRDVAKVLVGKELRYGSASENGEEVVVGTALMRIGENSRVVAEAVDAKVAEINRNLPPDIRAKTVLNRTKLVDATIHTISKNLAEGAILVIVVLFVLLGNLRAALITSLAIPLSMLITAIGMVQTRISGNLMSLGAIDFGLIVDGAVIIVENCLRVLAHRQHELGRPLTRGERVEAVFDASKQVRSATAFGEAIIMLVYVPILTLTGVEGKMFRPMAATVIFALAGAFVLSLTFVPAMATIVLAGRIAEKENILIRVAKAIYRPILAGALWLRWVVVPAAVAAFLGGVALMSTLGQEFIPTLDEKDIALHAIRIPATSLTQSQAMQFQVERALSQFPEVAFAFSKTGTAEMAADPMPPNVSDTFVILKPNAEWPNPKEPKSSLIGRIEEAVRKIPGNNYEFTQPIQMRFNELIAGVRSDVAVKVFGEDFAEMQESAKAIAAILESIPGSADVKVEQTEGLPIMNVDIDRKAIARYGLNVADVQDVLAAAVGGREVGEVFEGDRRFAVVVRLPDELRKDTSALEDLPIPLPPIPEGAEPTVRAGTVAVHRTPAVSEVAFLPLSAVARINISEGPNQISRENGKRRIVVQANVRGRDLGSFVAEAEGKVQSSVALPTGGWISWGGQYENLVEAKKRLMVVVPACLFLILAMLYATFNSLKYALLVFSGVPLGLGGGALALWLRGIPFSISAAVGFIALAGVAVLNGLVMISFINQLRERGEGVMGAIKEGSLARLRPVLMTALVASLGFVPMALATGTGAEVQRPLATVVIGGLVSSTLLTLLVLPALYRICVREERKEGTPSTPPPPEPPRILPRVGEAGGDAAAGQAAAG